MKLEICLRKKNGCKEAFFSQTKQDGWMRNENHQRLTNETILVDRILRATLKLTHLPATLFLAGTSKGMRIQNHLITPPPQIKQHDVNSRFARLKKHIYFSQIRNKQAHYTWKIFPIVCPQEKASFVAKQAET